MRTLLIIGIGIAAMLFFMVIPRMSKQAQAVRAIEKEFWLADGIVSKPTVIGRVDAQEFVNRLKDIDASDAPKSVQTALCAFILEVESTLKASEFEDFRKCHEVIAAKMELVYQLDRHRGNLY